MKKTGIISTILAVVFCAASCVCAQEAAKEHPIMGALAKKDHQTVVSLVTQNPSLAKEPSVLLLAVLLGNKAETVKFLIDNNAPVTQTQNGLNLLHLAASAHQSDLIPLLAGYINVNMEYSDGRTPIFFVDDSIQNVMVSMMENKDKNASLAVRAQSIKDTVRALALSKANLNKKASDELKNWTPLHMAVVSDNLLFAEALLENNASVNVADIEGFMPLDYAQEVGNTAMIELLKKYNAQHSEGYLHRQTNATAASGSIFQEIGKVTPAANFIQPLSATKPFIGVDSAAVARDAVTMLQDIETPASNASAKPKVKQYHPTRYGTGRNSIRGRR